MSIFIFFIYFFLFFSRYQDCRADLYQIFQEDEKIVICHKNTLGCMAGLTLALACVAAGGQLVGIQ